MFIFRTVDSQQIFVEHVSIDWKAIFNYSFLYRIKSILTLGPPVWVLLPYTGLILNTNWVRYQQVMLFKIILTFLNSKNFKGTVMQIEKALINDRFRVSKIS